MIHSKAVREEVEGFCLDHPDTERIQNALCDFISRLEDIVAREAFEAARRRALAKVQWHGTEHVIDKVDLYPTVEDYLANREKEG